MRIETFGHDGEWSVDAFPALDSPQTLVVAFCARSNDQRADGACDLHNQTMTITTLGERDG